MKDGQVEVEVGVDDTCETCRVSEDHVVPGRVRVTWTVVGQGSLETTVPSEGLECSCRVSRLPIVGHLVVFLEVRVGSPLALVVRTP